MTGLHIILKCGPSCEDINWPGRICRTSRPDPLDIGLGPGLQVYWLGLGLIPHQNLIMPNPRFHNFSLRPGAQQWAGSSWPIDYETPWTVNIGLNFENPNKRGKCWFMN